MTETFVRSKSLRPRKRQNNLSVSQEEPPKRINPQSLARSIRDTPLEMYDNSAHYILDDFNSIAFSQHRIYNLMKPKLQAAFKNTKCRCMKSKCQARYCDCFSKGQACSFECSCENCNNRNQALHDSKSNIMRSKGCHCLKSYCMKNYCECYHNGEMCGISCRCDNCKNTVVHEGRDVE